MPGFVSVIASATSSGAVTPSDTTILNYKALYVGAGGDVAIEHQPNETPVVYVGVPGGMILPVAGGRVNSTSTTATDIVWLNW